MLLKNALRGTNANLPLMIKDSNGVDQFNVAALMASMGAKGINPIDAMDAIMRLQGIQNDFEHRSNEAAKNGAASNTFSGADVTQFTNSYHTEIRLFVSDLTKDIITIEEVAATRKQEAKEAKKIKEGAEKVEVEPEETSEAIIPPPSAEEQIENLTELKNNPNSLINRLTEDATIFYNKLTKSKPKETPGILYERDISPVEQKYLDKLNKTTTDVTGKIADKEPRTTGLGPVVDAIDSFFDKVGDNAGFLMDTVEDMQREKILYNTFKDFFTTSEAEGAATSQDSDFDPKAKGPRGFDKDNNPIEGTRNELAKGVGELALSKDFTSTVSADSSKINDPKLSGGTSDESDITSFDDDITTPLFKKPIVDTQSTSLGVTQPIPSGVKNDVLNNFNAETAAKYGSVRYNASTPEEQRKWKINAQKGIEDYNSGELSSIKKANVTRLLSTLDQFKFTYIKDLERLNMSYDNFKQLMIGTYAAETIFGTLKSKISKTNVVGELQVTRGTLKEQWLDNKHPFGPNVAKHLGYKTDANSSGMAKLRALSDAQLKNLLMNNDAFNYISGAMIMINKLQGN